MREFEKYSLSEKTTEIEVTQPNPEAALKIKNIRCFYNKKPVLDQVTLSLEQGKITTILGPSGCGKTTLLRAIAGLEPIHSGEIRAGKTLLSSPDDLVAVERRNIGFVFQNYALFPHMTVLDNIAFGLQDLPKQKRKKEALEWLTLAGLAEYRKAYPHMLSGGEQQRVALTRCLARHPHIVLLDEPFSCLDGHLKDKIRENTLVQLHKHKSTTLMVTHDPVEALSISDYVALMTKGRIIQIGSPDEVYLYPVDPVAARLTGEVNVWSGRVQEGRVQTPFGTLKANPSLNYKRVTVLVRPEAILFGESQSQKGGTLAVITEKKLMGARLELTVRSKVEGFEAISWHAHTPLLHAPKKGESVPVSLNSFFSHIIEA